MKFVTPIIIILVLAMSVTAATELTDPVSIGNLGFYAYEQGEYTLAEKLFLKSLSENPDYEHARFNLATMYNELGQYSDAVNELVVLVENNPRSVQYQYDLGVNHIANFRYGTHEISDFYEGIVAYEAVAELDASFAHVQDNLHALYTIRAEFNI